jgi:hypothetical protein
MTIYKKYNTESDISIFEPKIIKFYTNYLENTIGQNPDTYIYIKINYEYSFYAKSNNDCTIIEYIYCLDWNEKIIEEFIKLKKLFK